MNSPVMFMLFLRSSSPHSSMAERRCILFMYHHCGADPLISLQCPQQLGFRVFVSRATRALVSCWFITHVWRIVVWWWSDDVTSAFTGTLLPEIHGHRSLEVCKSP